MQKIEHSTEINTCEKQETTWSIPVWWRERNYILGRKNEPESIVWKSNHVFRDTTGRQLVLCRRARAFWWMLIRKLLLHKQCLYWRWKLVALGYCDIDCCDRLNTRCTNIQKVRGMAPFQDIAILSFQTSTDSAKKSLLLNFTHRGGGGAKCLYCRDGVEEVSYEPQWLGTNKVSVVFMQRVSSWCTDEWGAGVLMNGLLSLPDVGHSISSYSVKCNCS